MEDSAKHSFLFGLNGHGIEGKEAEVLFAKIRFLASAPTTQRCTESPPLNDSTSQLFNQEQEFFVWSLCFGNPLVCPSHPGHDVLSVINFQNLSDATNGRNDPVQFF